MAGTEDGQDRRRCDRLDEDAMVPVGEGTALFVHHQRLCVVAHIVTDVVGDRTGDVPDPRLEYGARPCVRPRHARRRGPEPFAGDQPADRLYGVAHHSSMNTEIVPPQVSPTSKASSSAIP